jgi:transcription elongation factor Elf1
VVEALDKKMDFKTFFQFKARLAENRPGFTAQELTKICDFILAQLSQPLIAGVANQVTSQIQTTSNAMTNAAANMTISATANAHQVPAQLPTPAVRQATNTFTQVLAAKAQPHSVQVTCKHCRAVDGFTAQSGRFGYFVQCAKCGGNTPLRRACPACNSTETKVSKSKSVYTLACQACGVAAEVFSSGR